MEYLYEGSRRSGKSYYQNLLNEKDKDKEIDRLKNIISANKKATKLLTDDLANMTKQALEKDNIINELEKVFIECDYQHLQRKLKELKENK